MRSSSKIDNKFKTARKGVLGALLLLAATLSHAETPNWQTHYANAASERAAYLEVDDTYALGVDRHDLDEHTEILGWQLGQRWYFGRQDGIDSGLTFVWQQNERQQVSVSKDGLRLTRRF